MLIKKYAAPCRVDYVPSPYEPDEDGVMDVGYKTGTVSYTHLTLPTSDTV